MASCPRAAVHCPSDEVPAAPEAPYRAAPSRADRVEAQSLCFLVPGGLSRGLGSRLGRSNGVDDGAGAGAGCGAGFGSFALR